MMNVLVDEVERLGNRLVAPPDLGREVVDVVDVEASRKPCDVLVVEALLPNQSPHDWDMLIAEIEIGLVDPSMEDWRAVDLWNRTVLHDPSSRCQKPGISRLGRIGIVVHSC